ncbi:hypothetical protein [Gimibacter soli]|uniref:Lipoprotein n=1 Tax=Gimibacter soli TaxID=3024400 RepID=A0AAE9XX22_9PROT|nr:hypothetical protein [Gimibacter soli]WCL55089.1 hypothetical protein PH603_04875 [Gimibacter soli]
MPFRLFLTALVAGCLAGCMARGEYVAERAATDPALVLKHSSVEFDAHQQTTHLKSAIIYSNGFGNYDRYFLRADRGQTDAAARRDYMQLYFILWSDNWNYFDRAYVNGAELPLQVLSRDAVSCTARDGGKCTEAEIQACGRNLIQCSVNEDVALKLTEDDLARLGGTGLSIQIAGRSGTKNFDIPAGFFESFQMLLAQHRNTPAN